MSDAGSTPRGVAPLVFLARACAARPWTALAAWTVALTLSLISLGRLHVSASLEAMQGSRSASARAFQRVTAEFRALDTLLVMVDSPAPDPAVPATADESSRVAEFAQRLVGTLVSDSRTAGRIAHARCTQDPAVAEFVKARIVPSAPFYLGPAGTAELLARFDEDRLSRQFVRNEALVATPGPHGAAVSSQVLKDPLRLFELAPASGLATGDATLFADAGSPPDVEFSADRRAVLVRITSVQGLGDLEEAQALVGLVRQVSDELIASAGGGAAPRVRLAGPYAIAAFASQTIRSDAIISSLTSVGLLLCTATLFYRRWQSPLLIGCTAGVGLIAGFGVAALGAPAVSPLATAVAAMLAGLGVDYGIHFVAHFEELRAHGRSARDCAAEAAASMALPITTNCFTSMFGFISLWPSSIKMLSDFAKLGTAGLLGAWVAAFTLLPALLVLVFRGKDDRPVGPPRFGALADLVARRPSAFPRTSLVGLALLVLGAVIWGRFPSIESDLTVLHPQPNDALATTAEITGRFGGGGEPIPVLIEVTDPRDLLPSAIDAAKALSSDECRRVGVTAVLGIPTLLPDPREASGIDRQLRSADAPAMLARFDAALERSAFDPAAFRGYRETLARMLAGAEPPGVADLVRHPSIGQRLFPVSPRADSPPTSTLLVVQLKGQLHDREARARTIGVLRGALAASPNATLAGLAAVSRELEEATREGMPQSILISTTLVLLWLTIVFRSPVDVFIALTPLLFAASAVIAVVMLAGIKLDPINCIAIPLLDGIAVDAGVFLVSVLRQARHDGIGRTKLLHRLRPTLHAVLLASVTTITGFASLCVMHTPALRSLGLVAAFGIAASFVGAVAVVTPWTFRRIGARKGHR